MLNNWWGDVITWVSGLFWRSPNFPRRLQERKREKKIKILFSQRSADYNCFLRCGKTLSPNSFLHCCFFVRTQFNVFHTILFARKKCKLIFLNADFLRSFPMHFFINVGCQRAHPKATYLSFQLSFIVGKHCQLVFLNTHFLRI